jgi:hypothetical protein
VASTAALTVKQDERGTSFVETGVDFTGVSDSSAIDVRLAYLKTDRRQQRVSRNDPARPDQGILTELYKPLGDELKWIVVRNCSWLNLTSSILRRQLGRSVSKMGRVVSDGARVLAPRRAVRRYPPLRRVDPGCVGDRPEGR